MLKLSLLYLIISVHPHQFLVLEYKTLDSQQVTTESENLQLSLKRFDLTSVYCVHVLKYHTEPKNIANQYMPVEHNIIIIEALLLAASCFQKNSVSSLRSMLNI